MNDESIKKNISKNIGKYRELAGLNQKELAKRLGVVPSRISNWETGQNCPTIDILFEVCEILNVSINDIYGVYPDSSFTLNFDEQTMIKKYRDLDEHGKESVNIILKRESMRMEQLVEKDRTIAKLSEVNIEADDQPAKRLINYYYRLASAGTGQILFDMPPTKRIEIPDLPKYRKADYAIGVDGNSMEPTYNDGDTLLVEMTEEIAIGEIGIFLVDNESYVKKLGNSELISLNPESPNITLNETAKCMGKVIGKL